MLETENTAVASAKKGVVSALFGQFATGEFWKNLFSLIVKEAVSAFILSLGGTLVYYIKGRANTDSQNIRNLSYGGAQQPSSNPASAFSPGYAPRPSYSPVSPVGAAPSYPGFGT